MTPGELSNVDNLGIGTKNDSSKFFDNWGELSSWVSMADNLIAQIRYQSYKVEIMYDKKRVGFVAKVIGE